MENEPVTVEEERDEYEREVKHWKDAYQELRTGYWHIRKPTLSHPLQVAKNLAIDFMSQDIEKIYKTYIVVAIVCTVASALADLYSDFNGGYK